MTNEQTTVQYEARTMKGKTISYYTDPVRAVEQTRKLVEAGAKRTLVKVTIIKQEREISLYETH